MNLFYYNMGIVINHNGLWGYLKYHGDSAIWFNEDCNRPTNRDSGITTNQPIYTGMG